MRVNHLRPHRGQARTNTHMNENTSTTPTAEVPVTTDCGPAGMIVTVARTAADWRKRLDTLLSDGHGPSQCQSTETELALAQNLRGKLADFEATGPGEHDLAVLAEEITYGVYPVTFKLPRNYVIVGWLDAGGYRHANPACAVPTGEFLTHAWSLLNETDGAALLNRGGAHA